MTKSERFLVLALAGVLAYFVFFRTKNNVNFMNTIPITNPGPAPVQVNRHMESRPVQSKLVYVDTSTIPYNGGVLG